MPVTPFHFGPGLALKGVAAPVFSWSAFAAAQVLIDCETVYYILNREYPVHRFFHSFVGAAAAGVTAALLFLIGVRVLATGFPRLVAPLFAPTVAARGEVSPLGVLVGGLAGGLTHSFLDGIMHPDVQPFMPWSSYNPFLGLIGLTPLHVICVAAALFGLGCLSLRWTGRLGKLAPPQRARARADAARCTAGSPRRKELDMIEHRLDATHSILYVRPKSALAEADFVQLARTVDPYIERTGNLAGLLIEVTGFPGWDSLGAMAAHFRFVRDHHKRVKKVAIVTDAALGNLAERLASHFVAATIKHFPAGGGRAAEQWIKGEISV
jgi:hypothetical protein